MIIYFWKEGIAIEAIEEKLRKIHASFGFEFKTFPSPSTLEPSAIGFQYSSDKTSYGPHGARLENTLSSQNRGERFESIIPGKFHWARVGTEDLNPGKWRLNFKTDPDSFPKLQELYRVTKATFLALGADEARGYSESSDEGYFTNFWDLNTPVFYFNRVALQQKVIVPLEEGREATDLEAEKWAWTEWWPTYKVFPELSILRPVDDLP